MFRKYLLIYSDIKKHGSLHRWVFLKAHLTPKLFWISLLPSSCGFRSPVGQPSSAAPVCLQTSAGQPRGTASPSQSYHPGEKKKCEHTAVETHTHSQFYKALLHITSVSRFYCTGLSDRGNFGTIQNFKNDPFTLNSKLFFLTISLNLI